MFWDKVRDHHQNDEQRVLNPRLVLSYFFDLDEHDEQKSRLLNLIGLNADQGFRGPRNFCWGGFSLEPLCGLQF